MSRDGHSRPGTSRPQRVADEIQKELARLVQFELKDPRLGMVTITGVEVTRDFAWADVWFTVLSGEREKSQAALQSASGFLRTQIARAIKLRVAPQLRFRFDEAPSRGVEMSALIAEARQQDEARAKARGDEGAGSRDDDA